MVLEAVARLVVAHLCGNGKPCNDDCDVSRCSGVVSSNGFQAEQHESEESKKEEGDASICEMTASQLLISFLLGPLKGVFVSGNASHETCTFQQRTQYGLLLYHILKYARGALRVEPPVKEKRRLSISDKSLPASFPPTVLELCADRMQAFLASSSPKERAVGVAVLLELTLWNRWDLAIETIRNIINEMRLGAAFTAFARPSADAWELRILLLQLFTLTFQRAMNIVTEECDSRTSLTGSDSGPLDRGTGSTTASFIGKQINMQELEEVTVKCMKLFYNAPLVQRELALQIVSKTLLPEKQMNVASAWVECLFTLPIDHLCSLLGVDDTRHHRRNFGAEPQVSPRAALPSRKEGVGLARQAASADSQRLSCSGQPAGPNNEVGQVEDVRLPVRVLLGHVEPAYVIPPMNRTWNVFTVVQTLLLFHSKISTTQLFTVIHAALLGAWHDEGELRVLMSNLRALEFGDSFVFSRVSGDDEDLPTSGVPSSRKAEDPLLYRGGAGAITLRNLVRNARVDSVSEQTLSEHNIDRDEELAGTIDSATAVGTARGCTSANTTHSNLEDAGYSGDGTGTLVEFFWLSVLRQIRPQLEESFSEDKVGSDSAHHSQQGWQKKKRKDGESEGGMTWRACRFSVGEDLSRLRMLGGSILLNLYRRYANPSTRGSGTMSLDVMHRARKWLSGI
uniref:Uncharacterized protein TCIL3000_10_13070 n=1 Tax=Trypanosoma congolense (strain IL3000) TaxID=1068625 RepID=G0UYQ7_TRYCI|nr:unnamed protein product [Trypanosoma congolense IL3000]